MGIGYNSINTQKTNFIKDTTSRPLIGFKCNDDISGHAYQGYFKDEQNLGAGSWICANKSNNTSDLNDVFICKKAEAGNVSGVLLHNYIQINGVGDSDNYIRSGQLFQWAGVHSGVETYMEINTNNAASFENATYPVPLTYDLTNGGVKVASSNDKVICYAISNIVNNCKVIKISQGKAIWESTLGIKVRF